MLQKAECDAWITRVLGVDLPALDRLAPLADAAAGETGFGDKLKDKLSDLRGKTAAPEVRTSGKAGILARLAGLADPASATADEKAAFKKLRDGVAASLTDASPPPSALENAERSLAKLSDLIDKSRRTRSLAALETANPEVATEARTAFAKFDKVLGNAEITVEAQRESRSEREKAERSFHEALSQLEAAEGLPEGGDKSRQVSAARKAHDSALSAARKAIDFDTAMVGRTGLLNAISHGPLSPGAANALEPGAAKKLAAAYGKDALIADSAAKAAATAKFPEAITDNLDMVIDQAHGNFESDDGYTFDNPLYARTYAQGLLKAGGAVGAEYFSGLPDYIEAGHHFEDGLPDRGATTYVEVAQKRSRAVAGAMLTPDGKIDTGSDAAKEAIGHLLYNPQSLRVQTPALNGHVLKTVDFLSDPTTGPQASRVLERMKPPRNSGARKLVRNALGKGPSDAVDEGDARTAVLAAALKPLDQGEVGSCFATAPARRMAESRPLDAMKAYASLASRGKYKPPFGAEVPAVTKLPAGEDPLMRSWEYTTATAVARDANSNERKALAKNVAAATGLLETVATKGAAPADKRQAWTNKKAKLTQDVAAGFTFSYDPTASVTDANDGSSSAGRYILQKTGGGDILSKADFERAMIEIALASLGIDKAAPEAAEVATVVRSPEFAAKVCSDKYKPWELASGGHTDGATKALFGDTLQQKTFTAAKVGDPPPSEGDRTKAVLAGFLKGLGNSSDEMVTIRTVGKHGFNALPNHPSLAKLKGSSDASRARRMERELVDKGKELKDKELSAEHAAWMFDEAINNERAGQADPALQALIDAGAKAHRPTANTKPAALTALINQAFDAYHDKVAETRTARWKADKEAKGEAVDDAAAAAEHTRLKTAFDNGAANKAKTALMRDLGTPQFVIADSNWGSATDHTFFVIAPDPATGEPLLWKRKDPGGAMTPAGREWVDKEWASIT